MTDAELLQAYKSTGLTPEEVEAQKCYRLDGMPLKRFVEILAAEADGRLVVLPCQVGDYLYAPTRHFVSTFRVTAFELSKSQVLIQWDIVDGIYAHLKLIGVFADEIGKTVFLTREEAETALKEAAK